jgi:spore photoproduct lyase
MMEGAGAPHLPLLTFVMLSRRIRRILVEAEARDYEMTRRILARLPGVPVEVIPDCRVLGKESAAGELPGRVGDLRSPSPPPGILATFRSPSPWWAAAKSTLILAVQKGPFWRPCPGTPNYICCGYQVLQVALNCPFDCSYCILQAYLNIPGLVVFVNVEDLLAELAARWAESPGQVWRLGTGEFGDSLALDRLMGLNERLIPAFSRHPRAVLEIKTKWHRLEHLLSLGPNPQVIFAWSLNPAEVVREAEAGAASLAARLHAAKQAVAAGFRVAFHFDPLIYSPGWEESYRRTVALLGEAVPPRAIAWISLGALRFLPPLRQIILRRFPATRIAAEEMVRAPDGKLRYFIGRRLDLYGRMREWLAEAAPGAFVYLCMESPRVWQGVFGFSPEGGKLAQLLDGRAIL